MKALRTDSAIVVLALLAFAAPVSAQTAGQRVRDVNPHSWFIYYGDHPVGKSKWGVLTELQVRRTDFASAWQQLLLREGATYRLTPRVQFGGGYGFVRTYRYGDFPAPRPFNEHRLFEQVIVKHEAGKLELEHRYRVEQRRIEAFAANTRSWRYQNRFRYQLRGTLPLSTANTKGQQWYLFAGDELFVHFGPNHGASLFDQNRAFLGVGYKMTRNNRLEVSYMNQFVAQRSGLVEESNHTFRVQITSGVPIPWKH